MKRTQAPEICETERCGSIQNRSERFHRSPVRIRIV